MSLFGKKEDKTPFEKLMADYAKLTDEEKAKFKDSLMDVEKAEDEREIDKIEEEKADNPTTAEEKAEDVKEESEEVGKEIDEAKEEVAEDVKENDNEETATEETDGVTDEDVEEAKEEVEEATEEVEKAQDAKMDAFYQEWEEYKAKVDKLYDRMEALDEPAEAVGLGKQRMVEQGTPEEDLSAYEYAMRNARF